MNMGTVGARLSDHLFQTVILREIEKSPQNPTLYGLLGDLHYRRKNYAEVRQAYEKSLSLKADNPLVLNNLAWLLATCEDKRFREPARALELARRAAQLRNPLTFWTPWPECYLRRATSTRPSGRSRERRAREGRPQPLRGAAARFTQAESGRRETRHPIGCGCTCVTKI
jgi:Tfp pilus assembly protein PilF